jgi:FKBP-type peptidyl-prolyl cis-trans isomerase 2
MKRANIAYLFLVLLFGFMTVLSVLPAPAKAAEKAKKGAAAVIADGKSVKVNYTLTVDGKVVDSSKGRQPLEFKAGTHQMIPGFEKEVIGMKVGEKKSFKVKPEDGYGPVNPKAYREVPKKQLPAGVTPKAGMTLFAQGQNGQQIPVKIKEVKKDVVVIDFNHPLAGKTLNFDVEVVEVK